jgi:hypothetical protein
MSNKLILGEDNNNNHNDDDDENDSDYDPTTDPLKENDDEPGDEGIFLYFM